MAGRRGDRLLIVAFATDIAGPVTLSPGCVASLPTAQ